MVCDVEMGLTGAATVMSVTCLGRRQLHHGLGSPARPPHARLCACLSRPSTSVQVTTPTGAPSGSLR